MPGSILVWANTVSPRERSGLTDACNPPVCLLYLFFSKLLASHEICVSHPRRYDLCSPSASPGFYVKTERASQLADEAKEGRKS